MGMVAAFAHARGGSVAAQKPFTSRRQAENVCRCTNREGCASRALATRVAVSVNGVVLNAIWCQSCGSTWHQTMKAWVMRPKNVWLKLQGEYVYIFTNKYLQ